MYQGSLGLEKVDFWMSRLGESTRPTNLYQLERWLGWLRENGGEFASFTPDQLVDYQEGSMGKDRLKILRLLQRYIDGTPWRYGTKLRTYGALRGFFMHNMVELPRDKGYTIRSDIPASQTDLTVDDVRRVLLSSNKLYRAILLSMLQGGLGLEEFKYWNTHGWASLGSQLRARKSVIMIQLPGRKKAKNRAPYTSMIGSDAIRAIEDYLPLRPADASTIFLNQYGNPVTKTDIGQYWRRRCIRLGFFKRLKNGNPANRYGKPTHELRDTFRTLWAKSGAAPGLGEVILGHKADKFDYDKSAKDLDWAKSEYLKAEPFLNLLSSPTPYGLTGESRVIDLERQLEELRNDNEFTRIQLRDQELANNEMLKIRDKLTSGDGDAILEALREIRNLIPLKAEDKKPSNSV